MGSLNKEVTSPLEANLPFIDTDIDFDVEMEIIVSLARVYSPTLARG